MTELFMQLSDKQRELDQLKSRESKLMKDSQLALSFMKKKVPLSDVMLKLQRVDTALAKVTIMYV